MSRNVFKLYGTHKILNDYSHHLNNRISHWEKYLSKYFCNTSKSSGTNTSKTYFVPSKTAQNGLNFFTREDEKKLAEEELSSAHLDVAFKIIFILLKQNYDSVETSLPRYMIQSVLPKFGVDSLSKIT